MFIVLLKNFQINIILLMPIPNFILSQSILAKILDNPPEYFTPKVTHYTVLINGLKNEHSIAI